MKIRGYKTKVSAKAFDRNSESIADVEIVILTNSELTEKKLNNIIKNDYNDNELTVIENSVNAVSEKVTYNCIADLFNEWDNSTATYII